ncbi:MAG: glycosyltransferase, partial [Candidatus Lokiarchaeia archaeon]|nr:glycosyltransferase [Candidatus Lokiarchaeia archaeon]
PRALYRIWFRLEMKLIPAFLRYFIFGSKSIHSITKSGKVELIHARSFFPAIIGLIVKLFSVSKISLLYDNRGLWIEEGIYLGKWKRNSVKVKVFMWMENIVLKKSDYIVVVSKKFKEFLCGKSNVKIENKIQVISNNVQIQASGVKSTSRKNETTFVYTGSAAKWYSFGKLVELFLKLNLNFSNARFLILTYETEVFQKIILQQSNLRDKTEIKCVSSEKVYEQILHCDVGILLREENIFTSVSSPLKFAEYLNAGLPVIVNKGVGDTEEIIYKYNVGVVLDNYNYETAFKELKILLTDPGLTERCIKVAKTEFNQQVAFKQYLEVYKNILEINE